MTASLGEGSKDLCWEVVHGSRSVSIRTLASHHSTVRMPRAGLNSLPGIWLVTCIHLLASHCLGQKSSIQIPWSRYTQKGAIAHLQEELLLSILGGACSTIWADCGMTVKFLCNMILLPWKQPEPKDS